jgi:hypothetical protein
MDMNDGPDECEPIEYFGFDWYHARCGDAALNDEQLHDVRVKSKVKKKPYTCSCHLAFNMGECDYHMGKSSAK